MSDEQFGAFWDEDESYVVYTDLKIDDKSNWRRYQDTAGHWWKHFQPCVRPVPWPPEPVKKKLIAYITDDAKFQKWAKKTVEAYELSESLQWFGWKEEE